jgi:hypothetical protein
MKRIALTLATLALSAGAAFAATQAPATSGMSNKAAPAAAATHHTMQAAASRDHDRTAQRMTSALNLLEAKGYASFNDFKPAGKDFTAMVKKNGHDTTVHIDPDSGQITTQG